MTAKRSQAVFGLFDLYLHLTPALVIEVDIGPQNPLRGIPLVG
ncbi:MAG: hypothetical protein ACPLYD_12335 [Anaerolineae bacterium]